MKKNIALTLFLLSCLTCCAQSSSLLEPASTIEIETAPSQNPSYFNLANIVDGFINTSTEEKTPDENEKTPIRKEFISSTTKFNQGNATSAYEDYSALLDKIDNDISLLNLAKVFYQIGFFSLSNKAIDKIVYKNQYYNNILDLETSYKPKASLSYDDEIFFAKQYADIFYNNSASEAISELLGSKERYQKNDYYNFLLSQAYFSQKQYSKAINAINKAISINSSNLNYELLKIDILLSENRFQDGLSIIKKIEKNKHIVLDLSDDIEIKKQALYAGLNKNDKEKKYYVVNKTFLEGNFEKAKKDCLSILNFDKDNDKIISLYAKSELASGNIERANAYFIRAYKIDKHNQNTLIGLGDIRFIHKDYKGAVKMYKRAHKKDKSNPEILLKLSCAQKEYALNPKELKKTQTQLEKLIENDYLSYYKSAISIAQKNPLMKEEFLKRSININPMYKNALGELIELELKNKNFKNALGLINSTSFTLEKNYYYYYLCGLYNQANNKKQDAIQFYKTSLNLNPNFEIANIKLLNLIPSRAGEEI